MKKLLVLITVIAVALVSPVSTFSSTNVVITATLAPVYCPQYEKHSGVYDVTSGGEENFHVIDVSCVLHNYGHTAYYRDWKDGWVSTYWVSDNNSITDHQIWK